MTVVLHPRVQILGSWYYLCGRLMTKRPFASGIEDAPEWTLSGAVYTVRNPPVHLRDVLFMPWVLPIPTLRANGQCDIELVAQVGKDISDVICATMPGTGNPRYVGTIRYTVVVKRQRDYHSRSVHIGEILKTDDPTAFLIRLHAMPMLMAEPTGDGKITPIMVLIGENPTRAYADDKYQRSIEKKRKEAVESPIVNAGFRRLR